MPAPILIIFTLNCPQIKIRIKSKIREVSVAPFAEQYRVRYARLTIRKYSQSFRVKQSQSLRTSLVFAFIDELEERIDDGHFGLSAPGLDRFLNIPADRHSQGANLSFLDGHATRYAWRAPKTLESEDASKSPEREDLHQLQTGVPHYEDFLSGRQK